MGLETVSFIDDLVISNPDGALDNRSEGDDHLRIIKKGIKATFPGFSGVFGRVQAKGSAYTAVLTDNRTVIDATSTWTLDLTAAATLGDGWTLVLFNNGAGVITIDADGSETINGSATLAIATGRIAVIVCDGSNFIAMVSHVADNYVLSTEDQNFTGAIDFAGLTTFGAGIGPSYMQNLRIAASVAANILTIALKGNDGNDPSATNPVEIAFRNVTPTNGSYAVQSVTAALSVALPDGGTLGFLASEDGYVHVYAMDVSGTVVLAIGKNPIYDPMELYSSTIINISSTDPDTLYSTLAQTTKAIRYIGRVRVTHGASLGEWDTAPSELSPALPTFKKHGMELFNINGTFTVPEGVYQITTELWGGGGGGRGATSNAQAAGGGGGGYATGVLDVSPGETISVTRGAGGAGGNGANGSTGGATTFGGYTANGGAGGTAATGGAGGTAADGDINITGGSGKRSAGSSASGGSGGNSNKGGQGGPGRLNATADVGTFPGGGGGGATDDGGATLVGGAGAVGAVIVRW